MPAVIRNLSRKSSYIQAYLIFIYH